MGIGASAGGLAATTELLRRLGPHPGVALVIVHHLEPTHASGLVEILARASQLEVEAARDGCPIEIDHAYVLPPNAAVRVVDRRLQVELRLEQGGLHLPIDRLLVSLAADQNDQAVAVLLSGTGADGTQGVRAVKQAGGVTLAQDASAEYPDMPESAIGSGQVDYIMAPAEIARQLLRLGADGLQPTAPADDASALQRVLADLRRVTGVDFTSYKASMVERRVRRRALARGLHDLKEYAATLTGDAAEAAALCEDMLIHVTSFFRDPAMFEALKSAVFPRLLEGRPASQPIRIWVPGCSTGEEVYSLAICVLEFLAERRAEHVPLLIFGTDVSGEALAKARAGRFGIHIEHDVDARRLQRFFTSFEGGYQIGREVRDRCVFAKHDATRDPPFSSMDIVSCRNLLIYLAPALQERLLPIFHYALGDPGFLVLGAAESVREFPGFAVHDPKHKIHARTSAAPRLLLSFNAPRPWLPDAHGAGAAHKPWGASDVHREADRLVLAEFAPPGVVISDDMAITQFRGKTGPFLEPTPGVASFDLLHMVREELRQPLRQLIEQARVQRGIVRKSGLRAGADESAPTIELEVIPFEAVLTAQRFFVVLFKESPPQLEAEARPGSGPGPEPEDEPLAQQLASTRAYLQSVIEQFGSTNEELRAANEEVLSSNEELRSTNEELQMAKEELQATNEELRTLNEELQLRNVESSSLNDDLSNVLNSVELPIVMVGRDLRVRRFTPAAGRALRLAPDDVGRALIDIKQKLGLPDLVQLVAEVFERAHPVSRTAQDQEGHFYQLTVRPYITSDRRVEGAVLTVFDVDELLRDESSLAHAYAQTIVDTVGECLALLERDLRVVSINRVFALAFELTPESAERRYFYELNEALNVPQLTAALRALRPGEKLESVPLEREGGAAGPRSFLLSARCLEQRQAVLVALQDITAVKHAERAAERAELRFRDMLMNAPEAILTTDANGAIVFANRLTEKTFGYPPHELVGVNVDVLLPERVRAVHARERERYLLELTPRLMGGEREIVGRRKDGSEFPAEVMLSAITGEDGTLIVCFVSDITSRRASEHEIRAYQGRLQAMAFDAALTEERERRRIAADLHDRIGQALALAQIRLTGARAAAASNPQLAHDLDEAIELLAQSVADTRTLTFELSPPLLYELGLKAALSWLVEDVEKRQQLRVELLDDEAPKPLDDSTAALVFRAVRELLVNVFKHAQSAQATVSLRRIDNSMLIEVADEGIGFSVGDAANPSRGSGFGLFHMREQIARLGGATSVVSAPGQGTRVSVRVPLKPPPD